MPADTASAPGSIAHLLTRASPALAVAALDSIARLLTRASPALAVAGLDSIARLLTRASPALAVAGLGRLLPVAETPSDPGELARRAAAVIAERTGIAEHDVAIVLGSGWSPAVAALGTEATGKTAVLPQGDLPGFRPPTAIGHSGELLSMRIGAHRVLVLVGRIHAYEGHDLCHIVHPVRAVCAAGVRAVVLTNAAGGLRPDMAVGEPVLISDHLNLTARSPLVGPQFVDLTDAYSPRLREFARQADPTLTEGVYAGLPGPHYETPAEIRMLRTLGADLVGMSTVHETIAARAAGAEVLGVSLVTNMAAGIGGEPLSHVEVLSAGAASASRMGALLALILERLPRF